MKCLKGLYESGDVITCKKKFYLNTLVLSLVLFTGCIYHKTPPGFGSPKFVDLDDNCTPAAGTYDLMNAQVFNPYSKKIWETISNEAAANSLSPGRLSYTFLPAPISAEVQGGKCEMSSIILRGKNNTAIKLTEKYSYNNSGADFFIGKKFSSENFYTVQTQDHDYLIIKFVSGSVGTTLLFIPSYTSRWTWMRIPKINN